MRVFTKSVNLLMFAIYSGANVISVVGGEKLKVLLGKTAALYICFDRIKPTIFLFFYSFKVRSFFLYRLKQVVTPPI